MDKTSIQSSEETRGGKVENKNIGVYSFKKIPENSNFKLTRKIVAVSIKESFFGISKNTVYSV